MAIDYRVGSALDIAPHHDVTVIAHVVNNVGAFGAGFAKAVSERYPGVKAIYQSTHKNFPLGTVMWVDSGTCVVVANMVAQNGLRSRTNPVPLDYGSLELCLIEIQTALVYSPWEVVVQMPRIGSGLAGGNWDRIEQMIEDILCDKGVTVRVFDLPST